MNRKTALILTAASAVSAFANVGFPKFVSEEDSFENARVESHVQGIAISEDAVYCGHGNKVMKFSLDTGKCLKSVDAPYHTGDVSWHDGKLYTSFGYGLGKGMVQEFDKDLNLVREKAYKDLPFDGALVLDGILYLGVATVEGPNKACRVARVNVSTLELIDVVSLDPGITMYWGVQDMSTDGKLLFLSFYPANGSPGMAVYTKDFKLVKTLPQVFSTGFDRLPARFQPKGETVFGVLRYFTRKDLNGMAVPGRSVYLQYWAWDGKSMRDVTPKSNADLVSRPSRWLNLFNGKDLSGWTPKILGYKAGENPGNTFRVEGGCLCNRYDDPMYADGFKHRYGHLFYNRPFSNYVLRATYRMPLPQAKGGPGWAVYNNGIMLHGQSPESMGVDQDFPVSIECQLLSRAKPGSERSTANLCTPGTNVEKDGKLYTPHGLRSTSKTYDPDKWTSIEIEVHGGDKIIHRVEGQTVLEYHKPQYDPRDRNAQKLIQAAKGDLILHGGTISIQSESAPTDYKSILIRPLDE